MTIWAIGFRGQAASRFIETTVPSDIIAQLQPGEEVAPVTLAQQQAGVILLGDMATAPTI